MAATLEPDLTKALSGDYTPKFLATLDGDGRPNCVPVITITPYIDGTLIFGEFLMQKSRKNLLVNPRVAVAVINDAFEAWSIEGEFLGFETEGEGVDFVNRLPLLRYNAYTGVRSVGRIRVDHAGPKHRLGKAALLAAYLRASATARLLPGPNVRPVMPPPVRQKFNRMGAVRAVAFRGADGAPRASAAMACVAAGPSRLVLGDSLAEPLLGQASAGAAMAVAVITPEPVAYQVKGDYAGRRAGLHLVELTECYSASPPLLGERLDRV